MKTWIGVLIIICVNIHIVFTNEEENVQQDMKTFPKKMLARRREEHLTLLKMLAQNPRYELRFRLIQTGIEKVFELINENRAKLKDNDEISEAKMIVIENSCLLMDFIVNFNEEIYTVFNKISKKRDIDWKVMLQKAFDFLDKEQDLLDELTSKEYEFVKENLDKIYNEEKLPPYPYENNINKEIEIKERLYQDESEKLKALNKKEKKKLKKGPSLHTVEL